MPDPDNLLRWLNTCCPDWEGGFSMNPCCPVSISACVSLSKSAKICGYDELTDQSSPPKKYRVRTSFEFEQVPAQKDYDYEIGEWSECSNGCRSRSVSQYIYDYRDSYTKKNITDTRTYDPLVSCRFFDTRDYVDNSQPLPPPNSSGHFAYYDFKLISTNTTVSRTLSTKIAQKNLRSFTNGGSEVQSKGGCGSPPFCDIEYTQFPALDENEGYTNTVIISLSEEDTESDALSRIDDWTQGEGCVSAFYRSEYSYSFSKTTVKHEAVVTGLVIGFCYEGVIPIEQALVKYSESGTRLIPTEDDWLPFSLTAIDAFRADQVFQTFGLGTLNVSDDDFINENFSLDPYSYPSYFPVDPETGILIDPDALVLTPFSDLPKSKVYDYRVMPAIMRRLECDEI
jgi:hypothetical protein